MVAPIEIRIAYGLGFARSWNQMMVLSIPPGTTYFTIKPKVGILQIYEWHYGVIDPGPPTSDVRLVWEQRGPTGIIKFADYMTHSVMDYPYPCWLKLTPGTPVHTWAENDTAEVQTVDWVAFCAFFKSEDEYQAWQTYLRKVGLRASSTMQREMMKALEKRRR